MLMHQLAWSLGVGPLLEPAGLRPVGREVALTLRAGVPVLVMPGGDLDRAKPWRERDRVRFHGRSGFARMAQEAGVPIVPIVITGAGDTLRNLSDGAWLARAPARPALPPEGAPDQLRAAVGSERRARRRRVPPGPREDARHRLPALLCRAGRRARGLRESDGIQSSIKALSHERLFKPFRKVGADASGR